MISRRILAWLVISAVVLPIGITISVGVARLLAAMQDEVGAVVLDRVALLLAVGWIFDLVCLVIGLALAVLAATEAASPDDAATDDREASDTTRGSQR